MEEVIHRRADDIVGDVLLCQPLDGQRHDPLAVPQNRYAVRESEDLFQPMADVDDRDAAIAHGANYVVKDSNLRFGEGRGNLVEYEDAKPALERAGNRNKLALVDTQGFQRGAGINGETDFCQVLDRRAMLGTPVDQPGASTFIGNSKQKVLGNSEIWNEHGNLMHTADAVLDRLARMGKPDRIAVEDNFTRIGDVIAGEHADQGRFAGTVLADEGMNFTRSEIDAHAIDSDHRSKTLGYFAEREERCHAAPLDRTGSSVVISATVALSTSRRPTSLCTAP